MAVLLISGAIGEAEEITAEVAGIVVDASRGLPIQGAKVDIDLRGSVETDEKGQFAFTDLKPGAHSLSARKSGFGYRPERDDAFVNLSMGERLTGLTIRLTPEAVLSGRVTNWRGEPVKAWLEVTDANSPAHVASGRTGDGEFRIDGLPPGKYKLSAQAEAPDRTRTALMWYPGETDAAKAEPISLSQAKNALSVRSG